MEYTAGSLVRVYERDWVVQPNADDDLLLLKPLGGTEEESIAILKSLGFPEDKVIDIQFPYPGLEDIADFSSAKLLYEATRLLFRTGAGPFRCFGKLSFRPRSYQLVPLIMALRQEVIRLLIADDVGIGKTIEAGLIARELIDRAELISFAVVCPPHLCEQWQQELKEKFELDAVIIRSGNISSLEKGLPAHTSIYRHYPFQVVSIDYIKSEANRSLFLQECPDFVIVDEVHTCANTSGQQNSQQQRYALLRKLAEKQSRNLLLLTATPHSGKPHEFLSILGLLNREFDATGFDLADSVSIKKVVLHFIQRRRIDIRKFLNEVTLFSERIPGEVAYELSNDYAILFDKMVAFARDIVKETDVSQFRQRLKYWAALGLLRGVMSSPHAGITMLRNRAFRTDETAAEELFGGEELFDQLDKDKDTLPTDLVDHSHFSDSEVRRLRLLATDIPGLIGIEKDRKAHKAYKLIKEWLEDGLHPVVFCKYIETAKYLGEILRSQFKREFKDLEIEVITGEIHDEDRKEKIAALTEKQTSRRLLICTDCLSEGINLQVGFNALLHYDLPWNPNRLEQREGRIDRFGQATKKVNTFLLYGKDNPIDGVVLRVLLRKAIDIKKQLGISVPFPEDSKSVMEAVSAAVLLNPSLAKASAQQLTIGFIDPIAEEEVKVGKVYEEARRKTEELRNRFAQTKMLEDLDIEADLKQTDEALGNPQAVERFVKFAIEFLGGFCREWKAGYKLAAGNLPIAVKALLPPKGEWAISFSSPTPEGYQYIGRNHDLVEQLSQTILAGAFEHTGPKIARATLFRSDAVEQKTVLTILRVRNVMRRKKGVGELVAEELVCWGYKNEIANNNLLSPNTVKELLTTLPVKQDINPEQRSRFLEDEIVHIKQHSELLNDLVKDRSHLLMKLHSKYRKALGTEDYIVGTIVPPDVLGIYIVYPTFNTNNENYSSK